MCMCISQLKHHFGQPLLKLHILKRKQEQDLERNLPSPLYRGFGNYNYDSIIQYSPLLARELNALEN